MLRFFLTTVVALALLATACGSDPAQLTAAQGQDGAAAPGAASDGEAVATTAPVEQPTTAPVTPTSTPSSEQPADDAAPTPTPEPTTPPTPTSVTEPTTPPAPTAEPEPTTPPAPEPTTPPAPAPTSPPVDDQPADSPSTPPAQNDAGATGQWERTQSMSGLLGATPRMPDELVMAADGQTVLVRYLNGVEPCSGAKVTVTESPTEVVVRLKTGAGPDAATITCIAMITGYEIAVTLDAPLGDRSLRAEDAGGAAPAPPVDEPPADAVFSVEQYIGLSEAEAIALAEVEGRILRIARIEDEWMMLTMDIIASRVNIELEGGIVVAATGG